MQDTNGVDLMPCDDPQDKYCGGAVPAPDPTQPPTFPDNFPDEFFYQQAGADSLVSAGGNKVLAEFDLEGAFASGPVVNGDQIVFSRIRYKIVDGLKPDTDYKITQPYGTDTVHTDPGATGFFVTQDVGVAAGDFAEALKGRVGPFLQWAPNPNNPADVPPTGYVGDGVTPHAVTGSQLGTNYVRIEGPGIGGAVGDTNPNPCPTTGANAWAGAVNDCIQTNNFVLVGKKSQTGGVDVTRATYERNATGGAGRVQVLATSKSSQDLVVRDGDNHGGVGRKIATTPLRADGGRYMARVAAPGAPPAAGGVINRRRAGRPARVGGRHHPRRHAADGEERDAHGRRHRIGHLPHDRGRQQRRPARPGDLQRRPARADVAHDRRVQQGPRQRGAARLQTLAPPRPVNGK